MIILVYYVYYFCLESVSSLGIANWFWPVGIITEFDLSKLNFAYDLYGVDLLFTIMLFDEVLTFDPPIELLNMSEFCYKVYY